MRISKFRHQLMLVPFFNTVIFIVIFFSSCKKEDQIINNDRTTNNAVLLTQTPEFSKYTIHKGEHYCDSSHFVPTDLSELKFLVKFDSSSIYNSAISENQYDINKLYGFSDNNGDHHQFSARFGWRWSDGALRLFGYIYNNGVVQYKELGQISIGSENACSIKVTDTTYIFSLNNIIANMPRKSTTPKASGYKLFPYFGGDEIAPHDVFIWIKDL